MKKKADLKTRKEKCQTKQNSCSANNTEYLHFRAESSFQQKKIKTRKQEKTPHLFVQLFKMNSQLL